MYTAFETETKCHRYTTLTLKITTITSLVILVCIMIVGSIYGIKLYNIISPAINIIIKDINNITETFNEVSKVILTYGKNITNNANKVRTDFDTFSEIGLGYIKSMSDNLQKISNRIGL